MTWLRQKRSAYCLCNHNSIRGPLWNYWHTPWRFGRNIKFCSWQSKERRLKRWKNRESRSAVPYHKDRGGLGLGYGRKQVSIAFLLNNQSTTVPSRRTIVYLRATRRLQRGVVPVVGDEHFLHTANETSFFRISYRYYYVSTNFWLLRKHEKCHMQSSKIHPRKRTFGSFTQNSSTENFEITFLNF